MLQGSPETADRARELRRTMSLPEVLLWRTLRGRPAGLKFRRQHPSGPYVADFYCHEARLVIEIDGEAHSRDDRPRRDAARDRWFAARGIAVLRIPATDVFVDLDAVIRGVVAAALPLHHRPAADGPPPHAVHGEDLIGTP